MLTVLVINISGMMRYISSKFASALLLVLWPFKIMTHIQLIQSVGGLTEHLGKPPEHIQAENFNLHQAWSE